MRAAMKSRPGIPASLRLFALFCCCFAATGAGHLARSQSTPVDQPSPAKELRFPVAYLHGRSWCYGFLYGSDEKVRFEVVQPESARNFSFENSRAEVVIRQWVLLGTPQNAVEIKTGGKTYHMLWLVNGNEIFTGGANRWAPPAALPPLPLVAAMQNPSAAMAQAATAPTSGAANSPGSANTEPSSSGGGGELSTESTDVRSSPASANDLSQNPSPLVLAGVYTSTVDANLRPANTQYLFYPDGLVMNGIPEDGLLAFDFDHYRVQNNPERNWVGRYQVLGDVIKIVWLNQPNANPTVIMRNENAARSPASTNPRVFVPACRCTGRQLSGIYHWNAGIGGEYIQFFPNGTFIDHGVTDQMIVPSRFFDHPRIQNGRYQIDRQTIVFAFADGRRAARTFVAPKAQEGEAKFEWISLGRQMFFEEGFRTRLMNGH